MKKARSPSQRGITSGTLTQRGPRGVGRSAHFSESWLVYLLEWRTLDCAGPGRREYGIRKRLVQTCLSLILPLPFRRGCHGRGTHFQAFHPLTRKAAMLQFKQGFVAYVHCLFISIVLILATLVHSGWARGNIGAYGSCEHRAYDCCRRFLYAVSQTLSCWHGSQSSSYPE